LLPITPTPRFRLSIAYLIWRFHLNTHPSDAFASVLPVASASTRLLVRLTRGRPTQLTLSVEPILESVAGSASSRLK
jgi:hypothetical protein